MKTSIMSPPNIFQILTLVFFSVMISGCTPQENPANLVGKWQAEFTTKIPTNTLMEIDQGEPNVSQITTETNGSADLIISTVQNVQSNQNETITGTLRRTPFFRPLSAENKMASRGLLSWLRLSVCRSFCALNSFGKERTSRAWHYPSSPPV
jgi:hypothetical protein